MKVEVVYALPERQWLASVEVEAGASSLEAVRVAVASGGLPPLDLDSHILGIFGKKIEPDHPVRAGDRVEIYRPLKADPKEVRRALAAAGKTMGKK